MKWWTNRCDSSSFCFIRLFILLLMFYDFFFRLDFKKNCSFKSSFVDFFFVKLQVFVYFSLMRGILMIQSYLLMFFRFLHLRGRFLKFSIVYFLLMMFVEVEVDVEGSYEMLMYGITFRAMYRIISWNIWKFFLCT